MTTRQNGMRAAMIIAIAALYADGAGAITADQAAPLPFTAAQADHGKALFDTNCAACHGAELDGGFGGPPLKGGAFGVRWTPQPGDALLSFIRAKMPPGAAGTLGDAGYADVLAYILKVNGAKPGKLALAADPSKLAPLSLAATLPPLPPTPEYVGSTEVVNPKTDAITDAVLKARTDRMQALRPVTDDMLQHPPAESWLNWRRTYDAQGFSPLTQINRTNASKLQVGWSWKLQPSTNEITPLVHDGIMFVASGGRVQALDGATGDLLWQYFRDGAPGSIRNLAIYGDRIYFAASDAHLIALDMRTGAVVWDKAVTSPSDHLRFTSGPLIAKGKVIQGLSGCHQAYPGGCFIVALDADTGQEAWRFFTLARPGQPGGDTWNDASIDHRVGGSVWTAGSYDPDLDLVYFGTGQTYKVATLLQGNDGKPGSNAGLYTDSTLALRPETGELVWHYQHAARDVWDLDWAFERTLITRSIDGKPRKTVTTAGKLGIFDTLDAATGAYLGSYDVGLQNLVSAIDPKTGVKTIPNTFNPVPNEEKLVCPSGFGHRNWPSTAYDPRTGILYAPLVDDCMRYKWTPGPGGGIDIAITPIHRPESDGMVGQVQAIDIAKGKAVWTQKRRAPQSSAVLATAGDIIFEGSSDRWFRASDARTGKVLWQIGLDGRPSAFPITYSVNGVQYVAVTAGGSNVLDIYEGALTPEIPIPGAGVTLWVFRLPDNGTKSGHD